MRNSYFILFCLAAMLFLTGCGDDPVVQLEQDSDKIVQQVIINTLNEQIDASYGNLSFLLAPGKIMLVSSGVNQALNHSGTDLFKPLEIITVARKYTATKITCKVVGVNSSQVRKKKDSNYPYQAKLTISVDLIYEGYHEFSGFSLHAVIPVDWEKRSSRMQADFVQNLYSKLPPAEFDYRVIAEEPAASVDTRRDNWSVDVVWNKSLKHWELNGASGTETAMKAPSPSWQGSTDSEDAISQYLTSQGFVVHRNRRFQPEDLEIVRKLDQGLIYFNGKWQDPRILNATKEFHAALERWNRNGTLSDLAVMQKELNRLSEAESFPDCVQLATAGLLTVVKAMEQKGDEKFLEQLAFYMKNNPSTAISSERILGAITEAQAHIEQQKLGQYQSELKEIRENTQKQLDYLLKLREAMESFAPEQLSLRTETDFSELQKYADRDKSVKMYLALMGIFQNNQALIKTYGNLSDPLLADLYQNCSRCQGTGKQVCRICNGSGICQACHGRGERRIKNLDGGYSTVHCSKKCPFCPKDPICPSCRGIGKVFFKEKVQKRITDFYTTVMKNLNEDMEKKREQIATLQGMINTNAKPASELPTEKPALENRRIQNAGSE